MTAVPVSQLPDLTEIPAGDLPELPDQPVAAQTAPAQPAPIIDNRLSGLAADLARENARQQLGKGMFEPVRPVQLPQPAPNPQERPGMISQAVTMFSNNIKGKPRELSPADSQAARLASETIAKKNPQYLNLTPGAREVVQTDLAVHGAGLTPEQKYWQEVGQGSEDRSAAASIGANAAAGSNAVIGGVVKAAEIPLRVAGVEPGWGEAIDEGNRLLTTGAGNRDLHKTNVIAGAAGSTLPFVVAGAATKAALAARYGTQLAAGGLETLAAKEAIKQGTTAATAGIGATVGAGEGYNEAKAHQAAVMADPSHKKSDEISGLDVLNYTLIQAGLGATEALPIERAIGRFNRTTNGLFGRKLQSFVGRPLKDAFNGALEETAQELIQQYGSNIAQQMVLGLKTDLTEGVGDSVLGAGPTGFLMSGAAGVHKNMQVRARAEKIDVERQKALIEQANAQVGQTPLALPPAPVVNSEAPGVPAGELPDLTPMGTEFDSLDTGRVPVFQLPELPVVSEDGATANPAEIQPQSVQNPVNQPVVGATEPEQTPVESEDVPVGRLPDLPNPTDKELKSPDNQWAPANPAEPVQIENPVAERYGREMAVALPDGRSLKGNYALVEASKLTPSHDARKGFVRNPEGDLNERPYDDAVQGADSRQTVLDIASSPKPDLLLTDTPTAIDGPPVVSTGGRVLGGNARTMGVQLAYSKGGNPARLLYAETIRNAEKFGIDPAVARMLKEPMIVRVVPNSGQPGELSRVLNESFTTGRSTATDAVSRANKIGQKTADHVSSVLGSGEDGFSLREAMDDRGTARVLASNLIRDGVWSKQDAARFIDPTTGAITPEGKITIENTLVGRVVGDPRILGTVPPSVRNKLVGSMGPIMRMEGQPASSGVAQVLRTALDAYADYKASKLPLADYFFNQQSMTPTPGFGDRSVALMVQGLENLGPRQFKAHMEDLMHALGVESDTPRLSFGQEETAGTVDEAISSVFGQVREQRREAAAGDGQGSVMQGLPGEVTEAQAVTKRQTKTPAFKAWFGDSKVVDGRGGPVVVYHGTSGAGHSNFDAYGSEYGLFGQGIYTTEDPAVASSYTEKGKGESPGVYPLYVKVENPIDMDAKPDDARWRKSAGEMIEDDFQGATNEAYYRHVESYFAENEVPKWEAAQAMQDVLRAMGYDGITHIGGGRVKTDSVRHRVWIAFDPNQVKSATGNRGTFDPNDVNINAAPSASLPGDESSHTPKPIEVSDADVPGFAPLRKAKDFAGMRALLKPILRDLVATKPDWVNRQTGMSVRITNKTVEHGFAFRPTPEGILALTKMGEAIEQAEFSRTEKDVKGHSNVRQIHVFEAPLTVNGRPYFARLTVREVAQSENAKSENHLYQMRLTNKKDPRPQAGFEAVGLELLPGKGVDIQDTANPDQTQEESGGDGPGPAQGSRTQALPESSPASKAVPVSELPDLTADEVLPRGESLVDQTPVGELPDLPNASDVDDEGDRRTLRHTEQGAMGATQIPIAPLPLPAGQEPKSPKEITRAMAERFNRYVRAGKTGRFAGLYKPWNTDVVIKYPNDIEVTAHEIAHAVDDIHGITKQLYTTKINKAGIPQRRLIGELNTPEAKIEINRLAFQGSAASSGPRSRLDYRLSEAFAVAVRNFMANPDAAMKEYPIFTRKVIGMLPADVVKDLEAGGKDMREFVGASDTQKTQANIEVEAKRSTGLMGWFNQLKKAYGAKGTEFNITPKDLIAAKLWDSLAPVMTGIDAAKAMTGTQQMKEFQDPSVLVRLLGGTVDQFQRQLVDGPMDWAGYLNGKMQTLSGVGGLEWLLAPIDRSSAETWEKEWRLVMTQLTSEATIERGENLDKRSYAYLMISVDNLLDSLEEVLAVTKDPQDAQRIQQKIEEITTAVISSSTMEKPSEKIRTLAELMPDPTLKRRIERVIKANHLRKQRLSGTGGGAVSDQSVARGNLSELEVLPADQRARIQDAADRYRIWADAMVLQPALRLGKISAEQYQQYKEDHQFYSNMRRAEEDSVLPPPGAGGKRLGSAKDTIKMFKGGSEMLGNPYTNLLQSAYETQRESHRNAAMAAFVKLLTQMRGMGQGDPVALAQIGRQVQSGDEDAIRVWINGELQYWQFEENIHAALKNWGDVNDGNDTWRVLQKASQMLRAGITYAPPFLVRNVQRDAINRSVISTTGSKPWDSFRKFTDDERAKMDLAGGGQAGHISTSPADYYATLKDKMKELVKDDRNIIVAGAGKALAWYKAMAAESERRGRLAEFRTAYAEGRRMGKNERDASLYAALKARNLLDFAQAGTLIGSMSKIIPFLNAAVQGLRSTMRSVKNDPQGTSLRWGMYVVAPTLLTYAFASAMGDDYEEEYQSLPAWQRDFFWNFKVGNNLWLRIPKPFEMGVLASGVERSIDAARGKVGAFDGYPTSLKSALVPVDQGTVAGPLAPLVEVSTNYDFFRERNIVPHHEAALDVDKRTGTANASNIGQLLQHTAMERVDARNADHFIRGMFGTVGDLGLRLGDLPNQKRSVKDVAAGFTGMSAQTPASQARDVSFVLDRAESRGQGNATPVKTLRGLLKTVNEAKSDKDRDKAAERARAYAARIRGWAEKLE